MDRGQPSQQVGPAEDRRMARLGRQGMRAVRGALGAGHDGTPRLFVGDLHIRKMRDERADTPGAANTIVRTLKLLLNFAVDGEWIEANPANKLGLLKIDEWRAWEDKECEQFEARWAPGTMERRAYSLAIF